MQKTSLASVNCRLAGGLEGICNGIDTQEWSPFCDKYLDVKYDATSIEEGKAIAKETLQAELGLEVCPHMILDCKLDVCFHHTYWAIPMADCHMSKTGERNHRKIHVYVIFSQISPLAFCLALRAQSSLRG